MFPTSVSGTSFYFMSYQVKEKPKKIYESVTFEFTITNSDGKDYKIRKWEDTKGGGFYMFDSSNNEWFDFFPPEDLEDFIDNDLDF